MEQWSKEIELRRERKSSITCRQCSKKLQVLFREVTSSKGLQLTPVSPQMDLEWCFACLSLCRWSVIIPLWRVWSCCAAQTHGRPSRCPPGRLFCAAWGWRQQERENHSCEFSLISDFQAPVLPSCCYTPCHDLFSGPVACQGAGSSLCSQPRAPHQRYLELISPFLPLSFPHRGQTAWWAAAAPSSHGGHIPTPLHSRRAGSHQQLRRAWDCPAPPSLHWSHGKSCKETQGFPAPFVWGDGPFCAAEPWPWAVGLCWGKAASGFATMVACLFSAE